MRVGGILLSALGHAGLIALALVAPPWLRAHREEPPQTVAISLITETQFAAAVAALSRGTPAPQVPTEPATAEPTPVTPAPAPEPEPEAEPPPDEVEAPSLAPTFDPEAPLGFPSQEAAIAPPPTALLIEEPPRPRPARPPRQAAAPQPNPGNEGSAARSSSSGSTARAGTALRTDYQGAVFAAISRARVYPNVARDRGLQGRARLLVVVARSGQLVNARLVRSSGFGSLDEASLAAARNARIPAAPPELTGQRFTFETDVVFTLND